MPMFEGYVLSLKGHFNREVGVLRIDLQSTTTSIRELETAVTNELENIKKLITGPGYNDEEPPIGGGSPHRQYSPYRGAEHDAGDAFIPPAKINGTASAPPYSASTASLGVSKSVLNDGCNTRRTQVQLMSIHTVFSQVIRILHLRVRSLQTFILHRPNQQCA
uniref:Uncharacterized protein n=1 Tax=Brassica oleracea TaxID=3712 RepID=A0A3P6DHJ2_BRAOL|nr:unnamed protein product [Brassica oleracea]